MLTELLERIFPRSHKESSRATARRRLQILLAHDRADLPPAIVEKMRQEIIEVVSRYVELDPDESEFSLESDHRTTILTANLPIRATKLDGKPGSGDSIATAPHTQPKSVEPARATEIAAPLDVPEADPPTDASMLSESSGPATSNPNRAIDPDSASDSPMKE
jgi:cell division topological specificity factor